MKMVAVSQRADSDLERDERRDALDQRWPRFLAACGLLAVPLPNHPALVEVLLENIKPAGVLLTGGNDLAAYGGDAPERDDTEALALAWARRQGVPILGVCRGMQVIAHACGGGPRPIVGHVATAHRIDGDLGGRLINSYHGWAVDPVPNGFAVTATAADGVVEAFRHAAEPIAGIMWHPERAGTFDPADVSLVRQFFGVT